MQEIVSYIKDLISIKIGNRKVLDKDVANSLEITDGKLYTCKYREIIPYENIIYFCQKENVSLDKILFESK